MKGSENWAVQPSEEKAQWRLYHSVPVFKRIKEVRYSLFTRNYMEKKKDHTLFLERFPLDTRGKFFTVGKSGIEIISLVKCRILQHS